MRISEKVEAKSFVEILDAAEDLRWNIGQNIHEKLVEDIYKNVAQIADQVVTRTTTELKRNYLKPIGSPAYQSCFYCSRSFSG